MNRHPIITSLNTVTGEKTKTNWLSRSTIQDNPLPNRHPTLTSGKYGLVMFSTPCKCETDTDATLNHFAARNTASLASGALTTEHKPFLEKPWQSRKMLPSKPKLHHTTLLEFQMRRQNRHSQETSAVLPEKRGVTMSIVTSTQIRISQLNISLDWNAFQDDT